MSRSRIPSQSLLRAKSSSVMKNRLIFCAALVRMIASTSSGVRWRDLRPCTLMIVQNEHWNGLPRPAPNWYRPRHPADHLFGQDRERRIGEVGQVLHQIVKRLQLAGPCRKQNLVHFALSLAGVDRD